MPDFNWGFNSNPQPEPDNGYNDTYAEPEQSYESPEPESSESVESESVENAETVEEPAEVESEPAAEHEDGEKPKGRAKGRGNRKPREKTMPHIEEQFGKKLIPLVKSLDDEHTIALAKALTDTKKSSPEAVLDALTEPKNQKKIGKFTSALERLLTADPNMIAAEVTLVLAQGKDMTNMLFAVLNAVAPEKNFGRPTDDQTPDGMRKNLSKIVENWGDGVDLSLIDSLKI